jgi:hypothetical protein
MFEAIPFAVAMSPVVRVADPPGPRNDSAAVSVAVYYAFERLPVGQRAGGHLG